jgi:hypothetical protein
MQIIARLLEQSAKRIVESEELMSRGEALMARMPHRV